MRLDTQFPAPPTVVLDPGAEHVGDVPFLRGLVGGMRCGLLAADRDGRLILVNDLGCRVLGLPTRPAAGALVSQVLAAHPNVVRVLEESFSMSCLPNRAEIELGLEPGAGPRIGFTLSLVSEKAGDATGVAMFFKDLAPIEHVEEQERLRDRLAALGQMAASMAHEIRNPLASIEVTCALLKRRMGADPGGRELLDKVTREVDRLNRHVTTSLEYVRPVEPRLAPTDLTDLVEETVEVAGARRGRPEITVICRLRDDLPQFLMDRGLMRQVLLNLVVNAMEALGDTGRIEVTTDRTEAPTAAGIPYSPAGDRWPECEHFALIRVADDGPGIELDDLTRIFHPFFTTKDGGSGVGLATAKKIVGTHRGMIEVESVPGRGTEFTVRLPMILPPEEEV